MLRRAILVGGSRGPSQRRVRHAVRQMHTGITKPDSRIGSGEHHLCACLVVGWIFERSGEKLGYHPQGLEGPDVADRIRALIRRT